MGERKFITPFAEVEALRREVAVLQNQTKILNDCLRQKDEAMSVLFKRLYDNFIDCSDLIP